MSAVERLALDEELFADLPGVAPAPDHPYAATAAQYLANGWNPMPMCPADNKSTPPAGFTGYKGRAVTADDVTRWSTSKPDHHVGLRMPPDVIGIDIDHYGTKRGADRIAELEADLGPLPPTWTSTSRRGDTCRHPVLQGAQRCPVPDQAMRRRRIHPESSSARRRMAVSAS